MAVEGTGGFFSGAERGLGSGTLRYGYKEWGMSSPVPSVAPASCHPGENWEVWLLPSSKGFYLLTKSQAERSTEMLCHGSVSAASLTPACLQPWSCGGSVGWQARPVGSRVGHLPLLRLFPMSICLKSQGNLWSSWIFCCLHVSTLWGPRFKAF